MNKGGFSWKRATGVTKVKRKIAKKTGIPTTKEGRKRKASRVLTGGCLTLILRTLAIAGLIIYILVKLV